MTFLVAGSLTCQCHLGSFQIPSAVLCRLRRWPFKTKSSQQRYRDVERWADVADQAPTIYAVWGGGATPAQALYMVGLILPPKTAAA